MVLVDGEAEGESMMVLVDGDPHGNDYVTPIVYCLKIMQIFIELTNQSL